MSATPRTHVIVGVTPGQPDAVVVEAATFAAHFDAQLVCASVDPSRYLVSERPDGSIESMPIDPDLAESNAEEFDPKLSAHLASLLNELGVSWSTRALAGEPARALGHLADTLNASMIVVGTREPSVRHGLQAFFAGSVAVHLAHRQHRPVVIIPLAPVPFDDVLPWERA